MGDPLHSPLHHHDADQAPSPPIPEALQELRNQIDEIAIVGGSTRIPQVQQQIKELFNGKGRTAEPTRTRQ